MHRGYPSSSGGLAEPRLVRYNDITVEPDLEKWAGMIFLVNQVSRPKQKPGFKLEILDGEALLYHAASTSILALNQTATLIWQLCGGQHTVEEITEVLGKAYPDSADDIAAQVAATLAQFLKQGVIDLV